MKKILALILTIVMSLASVNLIFAEETEDNNKIEISFKVGDEILKINGKDVTVEKPVVINGVTLVPLRVISEAFGAEVIWNEQSRSVTLNYSGVNIVLYIDNKIAIVDGYESMLLEAPQIINGRTMVPLRFITENFGATVTYQEDTKFITVVKEIVSENSIKDFGLILKKTNKTKVGDSYHNWSMDFPKTLKLEYRNFTGTANIFSSVDETYAILLTIIDKGEYTLDSLKAKVLKNVEDFTLLYQGKEKVGDVEYVKIVWRDKISCCEYRGYISGDKLYEVTTNFFDFNNYKNNQEIQNLLNSFSVNFTKDGNTEDLSDVDENGYRTYENKNLKISFKIMADWIESTSESKENEIFFCDKEVKNIFYCTMYSNEKNLTLEQVVEKEKKKLTEKYNASAFKLEKVENSKINGKDCKVLYFKRMINNETFYITDVFVLGENYIYNIGCNMDPTTYNDPKLRLTVETAIFSFKFEEPDPFELGLMINPQDIEETDEMRNIKIKEHGCSIDVPASWIEVKPDSEDEIFYCTSADEKMIVTIYVYKDESSLSKFASNMKQYFMQVSKEGSRITFESSSKLNERRMEIERIDITFKDGYITYAERIYMVKKGNNIYLVDMLIDNVYKSEKNLKLLDNIWSSFRFE